MRLRHAESLWRGWPARQNGERSRFSYEEKRDRSRFSFSLALVLMALVVGVVTVACRRGRRLAAWKEIVMMIRPPPPSRHERRAAGDRLEEPKPEPKPAPEPKVALGPRHLRRR
jgi:hypothetical protein